MAIVAPEAILLLDGAFVKNNTTEIIIKHINKTARTFPSIASVKPLFPPSMGGNQGRNDKINTERLMPRADLRSLSSLSVEKEK